MLPDFEVCFSKVIVSYRQFVKEVDLYTIIDANTHFFIRFTSLYEETIPYGSRTLFSLDSATPSPNTFSLLRTIKDYDSGKGLEILRINTEVDTLIPSLDTLPLDRMDILR